MLSAPWERQMFLKISGINHGIKDTGMIFTFASVKWFSLAI
jgi:hypothetical protein